MRLMGRGGVPPSDCPPRGPLSRVPRAALVLDLSPNNKKDPPGTQPKKSPLSPILFLFLLPLPSLPTPLLLSHVRTREPPKHKAHAHAHALRSRSDKCGSVRRGNEP